MDERSRRAVKGIACAGIISAAAVTFGLSIHHGAQMTAAALTPASIQNQTFLLRQEECIYHAIRRELPKGATVYVTNPVWEYTQRLAELSTLWAVPQPSLATAQYRLLLVPARGHCSGLALEVRHR